MIESEAEFKKYIEDITGGPDGVQLKMGGTCQQPQIKVGTGFCDGCDFVKYCLCPHKKLSNEKRSRRKKK